MSVCAAAHCNNAYKKGNVMLRFSTDDNLRQRWLLVVRRPGWNPNGNSRLCEAHFELDQWVKVRSRLKDDAVPTLFCTCCSEDVNNRRRCSFEHNLLDSKQMEKLTNKQPDKQPLFEKGTNMTDSDPSIHQPQHGAWLRCWYRKRKCPSTSRCNTNHANTCMMSNCKAGRSFVCVNSCEKNQTLYKLLEEHVALKGELGRLRRLLKNSDNGDL